MTDGVFIEFVSDNEKVLVETTTESGVDVEVLVDGGVVVEVQAEEDMPLVIEAYHEGALPGESGGADPAPLIEAHRVDTTDVHGIPDTAQLVLIAALDAAIEAHRTDTSDVHGVSDTTKLARIDQSQVWTAGQGFSYFTVGLGTTSNHALFGAAGTVLSASGSTFYGDGVYYDGANWRYVETRAGFSLVWGSLQGQWSVFIAPAGTKDAIAPLTLLSSVGTTGRLTATEHVVAGGEVREAGNTRVYSPLNKPTPSAIGAVAAAELTELVQDLLNDSIALGANLNKSYNDATGILTLSVTAPGEWTNTDPEVVRDAIGGALAAGTNIQIVVNDAGDSITISTTATQNQTDAYLLERANHTGEQPISSVTGLQAALNDRATDAELAAGLATKLGFQINGTNPGPGILWLRTPGSY